MSDRPLRIMVVEDNWILAQELALEIRRLGHEVIGPFPDVDQAIPHVDSAAAAILDIRLGDLTSFAIADRLRFRGAPFAFVTGYDRTVLPPRFRDARLWSKPCNIESLLLEIGAPARPARIEDDGGFDELLPVLRGRARELMPDVGSADRLIEATLEDAVARFDEKDPDVGLRDWLLRRLEREHARHRGRHLH
jgi:CheY-like chemotaxis protein